MAGHSCSAQQPLSILRIATDLYPDITGGGAIHAHALSRQQAERGHSVTVLTSDHGDAEKPTTEADAGYRIIRHRELARPFENSITPTIVGSLWDRLPEADIVHAHSHLYFTSNVTAALAQLSETPLVITNHGLLSQTAPKWVQRLFIPTVARFTFNAADRLLCYTDTDRQRLRDRRIDTAIDVISNGIDCDQFTPGLTSEQSQQLVFVGRLIDEKGVPVLLSAFEQLAEQYPELGLRIIGDGPQRSRYEQWCRAHGLRDRISFAGDVAYEKMARHYRESRIFVLPSQNEGLPRTVLEAMACETPVVTTALPQLEAVVDGAGYTVEPGSPSKLAATIGRLLDDERLCEKLGRTGRNRVRRENSWAETVEQTTAVYYDLL